MIKQAYFRGIRKVAQWTQWINPISWGKAIGDKVGDYIYKPVRDTLQRPGTIDADTHKRIDNLNYLGNAAYNTRLQDARRAKQWQLISNARRTGMSPQQLQAETAKLYRQYSSKAKPLPGAFTNQGAVLRMLNPEPYRVAGDPTLMHSMVNDYTSPTVEDWYNSDFQDHVRNLNVAYKDLAPAIKVNGQQLGKIDFYRTAKMFNVLGKTPSTVVNDYIKPAYEYPAKLKSMGYAPTVEFAPTNNQLDVSAHIPWYVPASVANAQVNHNIIPSIAPGVPNAANIAGNIQRSMPTINHWRDMLKRLGLQQQ